jgi:hypothetical protein
MTATIDVDTSTTFVSPGVVGPTFVNVCVGDLVGARGTISDGTVTATTVFVAPVVAPPSLSGAFGTVTSVNGTTTAGTCGVADTAGTFTVTDPIQSVTDTVDVSTSTVFASPGVTGPTFANVCVGDLVGAQGPVSAGTVTANLVFVAPQVPPFPGQGFPITTPPFG